jgi:uncharacterized protein YceK
MNRKEMLILLVLTLVFISGCSSIHVGGSGKIGDVTGGGGVNIPIPQKNI